MKRKAIDELIRWKEAGSQKPVLLTGAKGVGKTYLAYDFAKAFFEHIYYIRFGLDQELGNLFTCDINLTKVRLKQYFHISAEERKETRILIADEISYCRVAAKVINKESLSGLFDYIICISSKPISDGEISNMLAMTIYPLEFDEFLRATGYEWYIDLIRTHFYNNNKLPDIVHKELLGLHKLYLKIGGMPGSVNEYLNFSSTVNVSEQHNLLSGSFHNYIQREYPESDALKMNQVLDSITHQLMKDNKKFQYKLIRKGTTHSMYKEAINNLSQLNYIIPCNRINNFEPAFLQESVFQDDVNVHFKLYLLDTGLLNTRIAQEYDLDSNDHYVQALLENYVAQALYARHYQFAFWESESMAKIDFMIYKEKNMIPIEVYADGNTRSKSLSVLKQKYDFPYAVKVSSKNFELSKNVKYVPYYAAFCI